MSAQVAATNIHGNNKSTNLVLTKMLPLQAPDAKHIFNCPLDSGSLALYVSNIIFSICICIYVYVVKNMVNFCFQSGKELGDRLKNVF